jgi:hypothetical protein
MHKNGRPCRPQSSGRVLARYGFTSWSGNTGEIEHRVTLKNSARGNASNASRKSRRCYAAASPQARGGVGTDAVKRIPNPAAANHDAGPRRALTPVRVLAAP